MRLALFEPDIPQNTGTLMRLCACLDMPLDIIGPAGFALSDRRLRRAGMDYLDALDWRRHESWAAFLASFAPKARVVLMTTAASERYTEHAFEENDVLLFGSESAGVPPEVHRRADARLKIPIRADLRSLNVALAAAMVVGEALRQIEGFPET